MLNWCTSYNPSPEGLWLGWFKKSSFEKLLLKRDMRGGCKLVARDKGCLHMQWLPNYEARLQKEPWGTHRGIAEYPDLAPSKMAVLGAVILINWGTTAYIEIA